MRQLESILFFLFLAALLRGDPSTPVYLKMGSVNEAAHMDNPWRIEQNLPVLWGGILDSLRGNGLRIVDKTPPATYVLKTVILRIDISKYHVGNPLIGGYQGYQAKLVSQCLLINVANGSEITRWTLKTDLTDRQLGFTVLAKGIKHALTFGELDTLAFNSPAFRQSLIFRALVAQGQDLRKKVASYFGLESGQKPGLGPFKVLIVRGADFHVNGGSADGLIKDQTYMVYTDGGVILGHAGLPLGRESIKIGIARVMAVKGNHLTWLQFSDPALRLKLDTQVYLQ